MYPEISLWLGVGRSTGSIFISVYVKQALYLSDFTNQLHICFAFRKSYVTWHIRVMLNGSAFRPVGDRDEKIDVERSS